MRVDTSPEPWRRAGQTEVVGRLVGLPSSELPGESQRGMWRMRGGERPTMS